MLGTLSSSTTARMRKRRPSVSWSDTKSSDHRSSGPDRPLAAATAANGELLLPIEPEQLLVVHDQALHPGLVFLQNSDDLLFREAATFHVLVLSMGQNELQTGLGQRGKVTANSRTPLSIIAILAV